MTDALYSLNWFWVITTKMLSDLFTKNLNHVLFKKFSEYVTGYETDRKLLFIFKTKD